MEGLDELQALVAEIGEAYGDEATDTAGLIVREEQGKPRIIGKFAFDDASERVRLSVNESGWLLDGRRLPAGPLEIDDGHYAHDLDSLATGELATVLHAPEGYLGKMLADLAPELGELRDWDEQATLQALLMAGCDLSGGLMYFGDREAMERYWRDPAAHEVVFDAGDTAALVAIAREYRDKKAATCSNVGGAKPKFLAVEHDRSGNCFRRVIVKFSSPDEGARQFAETSRQLKLEHLALKTLREEGYAAVESSLLVDPASHQVFFVTARDDRGVVPSLDCVPERHHWMSIHHWTLAFGGAAHPVQTVAGFLMREYKQHGDAQRREQLRQFLVSSVFSMLIGDTDNHGGNYSMVAQRLQDGSMRFDPAPRYDTEPYMMRDGIVKPSWMCSGRVMDISQEHLPLQLPGACWKQALELRDLYLQMIRCASRDGLFTEDEKRVITNYF